MAAGQVSEREGARNPKSPLTAASLLEAVPPHDEIGEKSVLGSMLMQARAADIAIELLTADDFYLPRHQALFKAFIQIFEKHKALDEMHVGSELERQGLLEQIGGRDYLGKLQMDTPSAANIENYCMMVREYAIERELIGAAGNILKLIHEPHVSSSDEIATQAEELLYQIADKRISNDAKPMTELMGEAIDQATEVMKAKREGREIESPALPTQYADLDRILSGGLWPGELMVIAGRPSMGKTTFAINIARQISVGNEKLVKPTAIFSMEMPREQVAKNILCAQAGLSGTRMRRFDFSEEEFEQMQFWGNVLQKAPIYIDDTSSLSIGALRARCRRLRHRHDVRMIVIDYLQLMRGSPNRRDNREQEVAEISRGLKSIARDLRIPVIVLSQLNRSAEKRENDDKRPQLSDLRESGAIEQDADVVIMLYRPEYYDLEKNAQTVNTGEALVLKNRNGPVGQVKLTFQKDILRFVSYVPEHDVAAGE